MRKLAVALLALPVFCGATNITYNVNETVGLGSVTGFIETDGTIGTLAPSDVLTWNLEINDGASSFDLLGPLSGSNSQLDYTGSGMSESATQLLFNFSAASLALFQAPTIGSGEDWVCFQGPGVGCTPESAAGIDILVGTGDADQLLGLQGTQVIGTTGASVPEPSTLSLLGIGLGIAGLRKVLV